MTIQQSDTQGVYVPHKGSTTEFLGTKQGSVCMFTLADSHQVRDYPVGEA